MRWPLVVVWKVPIGGLSYNQSLDRIVNKILETLKRHLPFSGQEGLQELKKIAVRFEEKIYTAATSQSDYLRKISLKMLTMETKSQNPENPQDPGSQSMQPQMQNQVQQLPVPMVSNQSQIQQQILSQNIQDNIPPTGVPNSAGLTSAMPNSVGGMSRASLDSSSQTGNASGGDWQEVIYLKIKSMNEMYFLELNEMCQRMAAKLQQHDALPQQPKNEQIEKLRFLKLMLERLVQFLRTNKNDIQPSHKDKVVGVEKQIVNFLDSNRPRKPVQQQLTPAHMHAFQQSQQQQPQLSQVHTSDGQMNSQVQAMNAQSSSVTTQQNNLAMSSNPRMMDPLQPVSNIDPAQGNALTQMQQVAMSSLQQNPVSGSQQVNMNSISSQNGLQSIVNPLQSNSNILQPQQIKQEQQMYTTQHIKQQYQLQMQQQYIQRLLLQQQQGGQQQSGQLPAQQIMQFLLLFLFILLLYYINGHC